MQYLTYIKAIQENLEVLVNPRVETLCVANKLSNLIDLWLVEKNSNHYY